MSGILFRRASLPEGIRDVTVDGGMITAVGVDLDSTGFDVIDSEGGALIPGLHDHHIHLRALAAASASVQCGPPAVTTTDDLAAALDRAAGTSGWVRGVGYVETVAGLLDCAALDRLHTRRPVRIQHRSGAVRCGSSTRWPPRPSGCGPPIIQEWSGMSPAHRPDGSGGPTTGSVSGWGPPGHRTCRPSVPNWPASASPGSPMRHRTCRTSLSMQSSRRT